MADQRHARRTAGEWAQLISAQRDIGQTIEAFCTVHGVGYSTFTKWKRRLAVVPRTPAARAPAQPTPALFTPLPVAATTGSTDSGQPAADGWLVELDLGEGMCLRLRREA